MSIKFLTVLILNLLIAGKVCGYAYGPVIDRFILFDIMQFTSFINCQNNATVLRAEINANIPVENVPSHNVMDDDVSYYLFTRKNPITPQILFGYDSLEKIESSNLNVNKEIIFYVHGYSETIDTGASMFKKYLLPKRDVNIIIFNWDLYAFVDLIYVRAFVVPALGKILGRFVHKLIEAGADPKKINLIGFSAGGEIVGLAGKDVNPKVGRVTAFDPEGSCYNFLPPEQRISKSSADFVQIVHCSVGIRALPPYIPGDVTFVMNGGVIQPNCVAEKTIYDVGQCSHTQCETYLFQTLKGNQSLVGTKCFSGSKDQLLLTYDVPTSARGFYFVDTVSNKPCSFQSKYTYDNLAIATSFGNNFLSSFFEKKNRTLNILLKNGNNFI